MLLNFAARTLVRYQLFNWAQSRQAPDQLFEDGFRILEMARGTWRERMLAASHAGVGSTMFLANFSRGAHAMNYEICLACGNMQLMQD